jgi:ABC-type branched-subunit amino acid transport system substrate-binding protein
MAHDVFISYAAEDRSAAEAARAALEAQGVSCWIAPRDVLPGEDETESILAAIDASSVVVLCLSTAANASKLVTQQAARAFNKKIPIVALRIEDVEPSDALKLFLGTGEVVNAYMPPIEANLAAFVAVVRSLLTKPVVSPAKARHTELPYEHVTPVVHKRQSSTAALRAVRLIVGLALVFVLIALFYLLL